MKTLLIYTLVAVSTFGLTTHLYSQTPGGAKSPLQQLQEISRKNKELIERQNGALQKLEVMQKEAEQIKFLAKRT